MKLIKSKVYQAYSGEMEIGTFPIASIPDFNSLFLSIEMQVAEQPGETLLKQELYQTTDPNFPYLLKVYVKGSPFFWVAIPIAITAIAGAVGAWQVSKTVTTVAESPALSGWTIALLIGGAILLILMLKK